VLLLQSKTKFTMAPAKKKQRKKDAVTNADWVYAMRKWCDLGYDENPGSMKRTVFLDSEMSGPRLRNCKTHQNLFSIKLNSFKRGELENTNVRRQRKRKYGAIEKKLVDYIHARTKSCAQDKCALSWIRMKTKCLQWANNLGGMEDFRCSDQWISDALERNYLTRAGGAEDAGIKVQPAGMRGFARKAVKMKTAPT